MGFVEDIREDFGKSKQERKEEVVEDIEEKFSGGDDDSGGGAPVSRAPSPPSPPSPPSGGGGGGGGGAPSPPSHPSGGGGGGGGGAPSPPEPPEPPKKDKKDKEPKPSDVIPGLEDKETGLEKLQRLSKEARTGQKKSKRISKDRNLSEPSPPSPPSVGGGKVSRGIDGGGEEEEEEEEETVIKEFPRKGGEKEPAGTFVSSEGRKRSMSRKEALKELRERGGTYYGRKRTIKGKKKSKKKPASKVEFEEPKSEPEREMRRELGEEKTEKLQEGEEVKITPEERKKLSKKPLRILGLGVGEKQKEQFKQNVGDINKNLEPFYGEEKLIGFRQKDENKFVPKSKYTEGGQLKIPYGEGQKPSPKQKQKAGKPPLPPKEKDTLGEQQIIDISPKELEKMERRGVKDIPGTTATEFTPKGIAKRPDDFAAGDLDFGQIKEGVGKASQVAMWPFSVFQKLEKQSEKQQLRKGLRAKVREEKKKELKEKFGEEEGQEVFEETVLPQTKGQKIARGGTATRLTKEGKADISQKSLQELTKTLSPEQIEEVSKQKGISTAGPLSLIYTVTKAGLSKVTETTPLEIEGPEKYDVFGAGVEATSVAKQREAIQEVSEKFTTVRDREISSVKQKIQDKYSELQKKVNEGKISQSEAQERLNKLVAQETKKAESRISQKIKALKKSEQSQARAELQRMKRQNIISSAVASIPATVAMGAGAGGLLRVAPKAVQTTASVGGGALFAKEGTEVGIEATKGNIAPAIGFGITSASFVGGAAAGGYVAGRAKTARVKEPTITSKDVKISTKGSEVKRILKKVGEEKQTIENIRTRSYIDINIPGTKLSLRATQYRKGGQTKTAGEILKKGKSTGETFKAKGRIEGNLAMQKTISGKVKKITKDKNIKVEETMESLNTQMRNIEGLPESYFITKSDIRKVRETDIGKLSKRKQEDLFSREFTGYGEGAGKLISPERFSKLQKEGASVVGGIKSPFTTFKSRTIVDQGQFNLNTLQRTLSVLERKGKKPIKKPKKGLERVQKTKKQEPYVLDKRKTEFIISGEGQFKGFSYPKGRQISKTINLQKEGYGLPRSARKTQAKVSRDQSFQGPKKQTPEQILKNLEKTQKQLQKQTTEGAQPVLGGPLKVARRVGQRAIQKQVKTKSAIGGAVKGISVQGISARLKGKTKQKEFQRTTPKFKQADISKQELKTKQVIQPRTISQTGLRSFTTTTQTQQPRLSTREIQKPKTELKQTEIQQPTINITTPNIQKPKQPKPPRSFEKERIRIKPAEKRKPHNVYVKGRKDKFQKINKQPLTQEQARRLGSYVTDRSLSAQFRVEPAKKTKKEVKNPSVTIPQEYYQLQEHKFREFRKKKGKKIPFKQQKKQKYIEEAPYRLDTNSETKDITAARFLAKERKQQKRKKQRAKNLNKAFSLNNQPIKNNGKKKQQFSII